MAQGESVKTIISETFTLSSNITTWAILIEIHLSLRIKLGITLVTVAQP